MAQVPSSTRRGGNASAPANGGLTGAKRQAFHVYSLIAIVVVFIFYLIARHDYEYVHAWARLPSWLANPVILSILLLAVLIFAAVATALASQDASLLGLRVTLGGLFLAIGVLLVVVALLVYRGHNFCAAFWLAVLALVLGFAHLAGSFSQKPVYGVLVVPLVVALAIMVYYLWCMKETSRECYSQCCDVNAAVYN